jgi:hypothetical protein
VTGLIITLEMQHSDTIENVKAKIIKVLLPDRHRLNFHRARKETRERAFSVNMECKRGGHIPFGSKTERW